MALTLVATAGATNANTYTTIAEADAYHESHPYASLWNDQNTPSREQALVWATRLLDAHMYWLGSIASSTQALRWPRAGVLDRDGRLLANNTIPTILKHATAELARWALASDRTAATSADASAVQAVKVGSIEVTYAGEGSASAAADTIPAAVVTLVAHLGSYQERGGRGGAVSLSRG